MLLTTKTRFAKRKLEITELRKDKHTITSKKHDKNCLEEKSDQSLEFKSLKQKYDELFEENKKNLIHIKELEEKIT